MTPHTPLIEALKEILAECEGDFWACEHCSWQDNDATRHSNLYLLIKEKIAEYESRIATETTEPDADKSCLEFIENKLRVLMDAEQRALSAHSDDFKLTPASVSDAFDRIFEAMTNTLSQLELSGLCAVVQYRLVNGDGAWRTMAAFDNEHIAKKYAEGCASNHTEYWEYRSVPASAAQSSPSVQSIRANSTGE